MNIILSLLLLSISCSFKKKEDKPNPKSMSTLKADLLDSDGDGTNDEDEVLEGSDPFIANVPVFTGDFFEEMEVKLELYNKSTNGYDSLDWLTQNGKTKFSWESQERLTEDGGLYMETVLKSYAANSNFKKNNFKFFDYNEGIFSYSSPLFFEEGLFSISDKLLAFQRLGYGINRAEVRVLSMFQITDKNLVSFRNPVFDIYYKSKDREGLIFIESKEIDGTYSFNEENKINIQFESFDPKIINEALLSGGASFFLKLRDFTVYETNETYSSIMEKVQLSSVPLTISYTTQEKKAVVETLYIGTKGNPEPLHTILSKALKTDFLMTSTSVDQIRGLSNRGQSYEASGLNETLKWYIGTSNVEDNVYSYLFRPNEGVGLAYISDKKVLKRPLFVSRVTLATTQGSASSGDLPKDARDLKIKFVPKTFQVPVEKYETLVLSNCPQDKVWTTNEVTYKKVIEGWEDRLNDFAQSFQNDAYISISSAKGSILEGNIKALIKDKFIIPEVDANSGFSLSLSQKVIQMIQKERSQISVEIMIKPTKVALDIGRMIEIGRVCQRERGSTDSGGHVKSLDRNGYFSGTGMSGGGGFEYRYDLDIHIFSY
jgi:hypothetical protein